MVVIGVPGWTGRILVLALSAGLLGHAVRAADELVPLPEAGMVVSKGSKLMVWSDGERVRLSRSLAVGRPFGGFASLAKGSEPGVHKLEATRRHHRDKELGGLQAKSIGGGLLSNWLGNKAEDKVKKEQAKEKAGGKGLSLLKSLFK